MNTLQTIEITEKDLSNTEYSYQPDLTTQIKFQK
jgi:hypothetical protein